jgi:dihydroneopterin aldolase
VRSHIGVPAAERAKAQELKVSLSLEVPNGILALEDDFSRTIDYFQVAEGVKKLAGSGERHLIEDLAEEIADFVLKEFGAAGVKVEVDKPILTNCEGVVAALEKRNP